MFYNPILHTIGKYVDELKDMLWPFQGEKWIKLKKWQKIFFAVCYVLTFPFCFVILYFVLKVMQSGNPIYLVSCFITGLACLYLGFKLHRNRKGDN
jgi:hypothetical protein